MSNDTTLFLYCELWKSKLHNCIWLTEKNQQQHQTRKFTISSKHPNEQKCTNSYIYLTKTICGLSGYFAFVFASCVLNVERTPEPSPGSRVCPCPNFRTQGDSTRLPNLARVGVNMINNHKIIWNYQLFDKCLCR